MDNPTENQILNAARQEFFSKGMDGARMQAIADAAGINKALLHYYFRSKKGLFKAVFKTAIREITESMIEVLSSNQDFLDVIPQFFRIHAGFLQKNPEIPQFIISEVSRHGDLIIEGFMAFREEGIYNRFETEIKQLVNQGRIKPIEPFDLLVNMISLSVFPVLGAPMLRQFAGMSQEEYEAYLSGRANRIGNFVTNALQ